MEKKHLLLIGILFIFIITLVGVFCTYFALADSFNPQDNRTIGYEFLDLNGNITNASYGEVVHIWNTQDNYFFNKSSGIQFTNHFQDYWTRNIFCIGYYNNGTWNKIKCVDELSNFNRDIHTDNSTYVNATLWKWITLNIDGNEYPFRFGLRYHLGLDDENLSITIQGKNRDVEIPYDLGFAWKVTDVEIPSISSDSIYINETKYSLNGDYDMMFTEMLNSNFRIFDDSLFLRMGWDKNLNYGVKMYGDGNQSNFYVALLINAGHFSPNQEKSTTIHWIDADIQIDSSIDGIFQKAATGRGLVWANKDTGYVFFIDSSDELHYRKTTDAGSTWNTEVVISTDTIQKFVIWYDKWTNGDSGTKIHIAFVESSDDDIIYNSLDTSGDSLSGEVVVLNGATVIIASDWEDSCISIVKSRGGNLFIGGWIDPNGESGFWKSSDGSSWTSKANVTDGNAVDTILFEPGAEADSDDIWCIYWDKNESELTLKVYDDSGNSWNETQIEPGTFGSSTYFQMDSCSRHTDNHVILVCWDLLDDPIAWLTVFDIGNSTNITQKTNVVENVDDCAQCAIMINQQTDDLYVAYIGKSDGSETWTGTVNTYYKNSTDGGTNWGNEIILSATGDDHRQITGGTSVGYNGGRWMPIWFNDDLNDLITNKDNSIGIDFVDITEPTYSNAQTNTTCTRRQIKFSILYNDDAALHTDGQYIFSTNNTGSWVNDTTLCYQETANVSTACGGLDTGTYSSGGYWNDGLWNTGIGTPPPLFVNYSKPTNSLNSSLWKVEDGEGIFNLPVDNVCWDRDPLEFKVNVSQIGGDDRVRWFCYNGTEWINLRTSGIENVDVYEEAMWWEISAVNFTATPQWANVTKTLNSTSGLTIGYRWYAYDNASNSNHTDIYLLTTRTCDSNRTIIGNFSTSNLVDRYKGFDRDIFQSFTIKNIIDRIIGFFRGIIQSFTITDLVDRISSFFRDVVQSFGITDLVDRVRSVLRDIIQTININNLMDRLGSFFRTIIQSFTITNLVERLGEFFKTIPDSFTIIGLVERIGNFGKDVIQSFGMTDLVDRLRSVARDVLQSIGITNLVDRIGSFFRDVIQSLSINAIIEGIGGVTRTIIQSLNITNLVERVGSFFREIIQPLNITDLVDRMGSFFRNVIQIININAILEGLGGVVRDVLQSIGITDLIDRLGSALRDVLQPLSFGEYQFPTDDLVGWWTLDEDHNLTDVSGNGNHGTVSGATHTSSGYFDWGYEFDGINNYISIPSSKPALTNLTQTAWVKYDIIQRGGAIANRQVIVREGGGDTCMIYQSSSSDNIQATAYNGVDWSDISLGAISINTWYHVANTIESNGTHVIHKVYLNGTLTNSKTTTGTMSSNTGASIGGLSYPLNGSIDEVMIFNRSLSATEVQQIYDATSNRKGFVVSRIYTGIRFVDESFILSNLVNRIRSVLRDTIQTININNLVDRIGSFFRDIPQVLNINAIIEGIGGVLRTIVQSLNIHNLVDRVGDFGRDVIQSLGITDLVDRVGSFFRDVIQTININAITDKFYSFMINISQTININNLVERIGEFGRGIIQTLNINNLVDRVGSFFRTIIQSLNINNIVERVGSILRDVTQSLNINAIIEGIGGVTRTIIQSFGMTDLVDRLIELNRNIIQTLNINNLVDRISSFFRDVVQSFGITDLVDRVRNVLRDITQTLNINNLVERLGSFFRTIIQSFNISNLVDRVGSFFRNITQSFTITDLVDRVRNVSRNIIQFFQMIFSLSYKGTFGAWVWITSVETTTQLPAYEGSRVQWELNDTWTSNAGSPQNWVNTTKTYNLPIDCAELHIEIDGVNVTSSVLVNNTLCDYTIINNNSIVPGASSLINITYTTNTILSSEGSWIASNKRISQNTSWINTLTITNPSIHNYTNISINITADQNAITATINITNSTPSIFTHTFDNTNGNVNWSLDSLNSLDNHIFTTKYKTQEIKINTTNHTDVIGGKTYEVYNVTINTTSTRPIYDVYTYFNFTEAGIVANKFYKCSDGLANCTEDISNRVDVVWDDRDGDGSEDYIEWYITNLTTNQSYQLYNDKGLPVEVTISKEILNKPIYVFDNIVWEVTITMYNPNAFATEKIYKYEFPLGSLDIELDDIRKNLQYDPYGTLAPYVTIIDKDQSGLYPDSVYLSPGETKTFILEYRTSSVTLDSSTYFPSYFKVDKNALINQVLRIKNQAEDNVTDIEYRIPIDYGEDLIVCEGEYKDGCPDNTETAEYDRVTIDTQSTIKGDYLLSLDSLESGETQYVTLSYYTPTAVVTSTESGRRSVGGNLTTFKKITIDSQAKFTMGDIRYREPEILCENLVKISKCRPSGICDIPIGYTCPLEVKLGVLGMGESVTIYVWFVDERPDDAITINWITNLWNWGERYTLEGFWTYILGWIASEDPETGEIYVTQGRIIIMSVLILTCIAIAYLLFKSSVKKRKRWFMNKLRLTKKIENEK